MALAAAIDLGPELDGDALMASMAKVLAPVAAAVAVGKTMAELSGLTVKELKVMAQEQQIARYSRMKKAELVAALAA